jgi:hypothetical protein
MQVARLLGFFFGSNCSFSISSVRTVLKKRKLSWSRFNSFLKSPNNHILVQCWLYMLVAEEMAFLHALVFF